MKAQTLEILRMIRIAFVAVEALKELGLPLLPLKASVFELAAVGAALAFAAR